MRACVCACVCVSKCVRVFVFHLLSHCFSLSLPFFISLLLDARSKMIFIFVAGSLKGFFLWSLYACLDFHCSSFARSFSHWSFVFMLIPFEFDVDVAFISCIHFLQGLYVFYFITSLTLATAIHSIFSCVVLTGWWICSCAYSIFKQHFFQFIFFSSPFLSKCLKKH